jgi:hypothetical protein
MAKLEKYSNREIDEFKGDVEKYLVRIETQVTKTNGHVADIIRWKERWMGASYVILIIVIPILSWALYQLTTIDGKIKQGISQILEERVNNIEYAK